jgi:Fe-S-cluster-containing dehydrogenase component
MAIAAAILVDLDKCVGCSACAIACKQKNGLKEGQKFIEVIEIGPEEVDGRLCTEYYPIFNARCPFCTDRTSQGLKPFCVTVCPTKALAYCDVTEILGVLSSKKRSQICRIDNVKK